VNAESGILEKLEWIQDSLSFFVPELILCGAILVILLGGISIPSLRSGRSAGAIFTIAVCALCSSSTVVIAQWSNYATPVALFSTMIKSNDFSAYLIILCDLAGLFTLLMSLQKDPIQRHIPEYAALLLAVVLGAHLLLMSTNLVMVFLSLEMISISSYVLAGFNFQKSGAEGSLKYFMFGAVASAVMLYGFSLLYGLTGTLDISSTRFVDQLLHHQSNLLLVAGLLSMSGFLFKMAASPMHPWAPDVYEAAPMPIVAFFSVVPKLAGLGILIKFLLAVNVFGQSFIDWQFIIGIISIITISVGNFAALRQTSPKRMMAYSSIAQSGFLLIGVTAFMPEGMHFMLFYAAIYLLANYLVFFYLQIFEKQKITTIQDFEGSGKSLPVQHIFLLTGLISLTGIPPTAGFTAKVLIFTGLWESYESSGKSFLLWVLVIGLLNTVISLFYYARIPMNAFFRAGSAEPTNYLTWKNFFGLILVVMILLLFFQPNLLMGWINKINFVL
jgi:NADH-quinone oxidoreductase subunit N